MSDHRQFYHTQPASIERFCTTCGSNLHWTTEHPTQPAACKERIGIFACEVEGPHKVHRNNNTAWGNIEDFESQPAAAERRPHLVHEAKKMILTRAAKYFDPKNLEWEFEDANKWERHAINAVLDLEAALSREREAVRRCHNLAEKQGSYFAAHVIREAYPEHFKED